MLHNHGDYPLSLHALLCLEISDTPLPALFFQGINHVQRLLCQPEIHNDLLHRMATGCESGGLNSQTLKRSMKRPAIFQRNKAKYKAMTS